MPLPGPKRPNQQVEERGGPGEEKTGLANRPARARLRHIGPCLNPDCTRKNPMKGNWCTAKECKKMRALGMAAKKQDTLHKACAAVGVPVPAAMPADGGQCFELHSVHGVLDCNFPHRGGKALEKAPPDDPKELCFLRVYGTFAATEDDFENDRGCKDMLKVVKYKELYDNLGDKDRSTLHKYAQEKSESLRVSLKRAREAE